MMKLTKRERRAIEIAGEGQEIALPAGVPTTPGGVICSEEDLILEEIKLGREAIWNNRMDSRWIKKAAVEWAQGRRPDVLSTHSMSAVHLQGRFCIVATCNLNVHIIDYSREYERAKYEEANGETM